MRFRVYPYKLGSQSAHQLAQAFGGLCVRPDGRYRYREGDLVVNWGASKQPAWATQNMVMLNKTEAVRIASNKLLTLQKLAELGVPHVPFTTEGQVASAWCRDGETIYARNKLTGHSGEGIVVFTDDDIRPNIRAGIIGAPLYTKAINNHGEYRVHVFSGEVIDYRKKSRQREDAPTDEQKLVRNLASGWVYRGGHLKRLERIEKLAVDAVSALGLDFGAVDIIKDEDGNVHVLEVNTAMGLEDRTLQNYVGAIKSKFNL